MRSVRSLCFWLVIEIVSYFRVLQALVDLLLRYILLDYVIPVIPRVPLTFQTLVLSR